MNCYKVVDAVVVDKSYQIPYYEVFVIGNRGFPETESVFYPEKFEVTVKYGNLTKTIDDEHLYNLVDKYDTITIIIRKKPKSRD